MPTYFQAVFKEYTVRGLSVNRKGHVTETDFLERMQDHPGNRHDYVGFIAAQCGHLRSLRSEDRQRFCVYDTATEADCSHADVCQSVLPDPSLTRQESKTERMKTARTLQAQFGPGVAETLSEALPCLA